MKTCVISWCERDAHIHGLCPAHWHRQNKGMDLNKPFRTTPGELPRFLRSKIKEDTDKCIIWPYTKINGYGHLRIGKKHHRVHNLALRLTAGPPPEGKPIACHRCRNRACFNPKHIYWGSYKENSFDRRRDGTYTRGEEHPASKLTVKDVLSIREDPRSNAEIAASYNVHKDNVLKIKKGKSWAWL